MTFLAPLFLLGLLAAAIPIAIHLIRREKPPKIVFSTLRFIKTTKKKLVLFQQIQQWLLLLLRSALICLLVFAFARPLFDTSIARMLDTEPESAVILLDVSLSMQYGENFNRAKQAVEDILAELSSGDEVALITFASSTVSAMELTTDITQLRARIDGLSGPGFDKVRFFPALRLANEMLESSRYENREIYLISDFQANGLDASEGEASESGWRLAPGIVFNGIDVGESQTRNLVLSDVRSPAQIVEDESQYDILARVRSTGSVHLQNAEVTLRMDGATLMRVPVDLRDTSEAVVTLPVNFERSGAHTGEIIVSGDEFTADNSWFFTIDVLPQIRVLVINGEPSLNWYDDESHWLVLALQGMGSTPFLVETVDAPRFNSNVLAQTDVVVLLNVDDLDNAAAAEISTYVQDGGTAFFAPGDRVSAERFNQQFGRVAPAELEQPLLLRQGISAGAGEYLVIADIDRRHPALRPLAMDWSARFEGIWSSAESTDAEVLMRFDNAMPALLERNIGEGKTMLFTSSLDLEWSNLPLQGLFVPFMHETLRYMVQPILKQRAYTIGEIIDMSLEVSAGSSTLAVRDVDGTARSLSAGSAFYSAQRPGVLQVGNEAAAYYAVNIDPQASVLTRVAPSTLHDRIINTDTTPQQSTQVRTAELIAELEQPQRLWWWIMILAVMLVLVEGYIANRTYR